MVYRILFTKYASKSMRKMPQETKDSIRLSLTRIKVRPFDFLEKMISHPYYKLRVSDYRIIIDIINDDLVVLVVEVGHPKNVYKRFG